MVTARVDASRGARHAERRGSWCAPVTLRWVVPKVHVASAFEREAGRPCDVSPRHGQGGCRAVFHVPPPPSGLTLGLTGLAGLSVYQLARSVRKIQFAGVPQWYCAYDEAPVGDVVLLAVEGGAVRLVDTLSDVGVPTVRYEYRLAAGVAKGMPFWLRPCPRGGYRMDGNPRGPPPGFLLPLCA